MPGSGHDSTHDRPIDAPNAAGEVLAVFRLVYAMTRYWQLTGGYGTELDPYLGVLGLVAAVGLWTASRWGLIAALAFFVGLLAKHALSLVEQPGDGDVPIVVRSVLVIVLLIGLRDAFLAPQRDE